MAEIRGRRSKGSKKMLREANLLEELKILRHDIMEVMVKKTNIGGGPISGKAGARFRESRGPISGK